VNRAVEAVAKGQDRLLLVMATGTGKTYTAFQIIWRLWKAGVKKRILFLADRNILVDQAKQNDFKPFGKAMTKIRNRKVNKEFEIYLALYQAISGTDDQADIFKQFSPAFFDLIVVDECHRGRGRRHRGHSDAQGPPAHGVRDAYRDHRTIRRERGVREGRTRIGGRSLRDGFLKLGGDYRCAITRAAGPRAASFS
jgi:DNA-binding Lrp family transcriptional regulator